MAKTKPIFPRVISRNQSVVMVRRRLDSLDICPSTEALRQCAESSPHLFSKKCNTGGDG